MKISRVLHIISIIEKKQQNINIFMQHYASTCREVLYIELKVPYNKCVTEHLTYKDDTNE